MLPVEKLSKPFFKISLALYQRVVKQNLLISLLYNISVACLTAWVVISLGAMAPGLMALGMGVQSLLVLANTYRLNVLLNPGVIDENVNPMPNLSKPENTLADLNLKPIKRAELMPCPTANLKQTDDEAVEQQHSQRMF